MIYHYEDEETFRMAISQINEFLLREGYSKMDEWLKRPYYKREDIIFVRNNYEKVTIDKKENWLIITIQKYSRDGYPFFKEHNILYIIYKSYQMKNAAIIEKIINDVIGK